LGSQAGTGTRLRPKRTAATEKNEIGSLIPLAQVNSGSIRISDFS
jgi:hypothetical protein